MSSNTHWTNKSFLDFVYGVGAGVVDQLQQALDRRRLTHADFARMVARSPGRVSQVMNNPGNLTLKTVGEWSRALGLGFSIVLYDDRGADLENGPIHPDIFRTCWESASRPRNQFELENIAHQLNTHCVVELKRWAPPQVKFDKVPRPDGSNIYPSAANEDYVAA